MMNDYNNDVNEATWLSDTNQQISVWDVSGQLRNDNWSYRKWIGFFDRVPVFIFVASLSCYDQVCQNDPNVNMMQETLDLFEQLYLSRHLRKVRVFLLYFNKYDLFEEKAKYKSVSQCFDDYNGDLTIEDQYNFIKDKFVQITKYDMANSSRIFHTYRCQAIDETSVESVFADVDNYAQRGVMIQDDFLLNDAPVSFYYSGDTVQLRVGVN